MAHYRIFFLEMKANKATVIDCESDEQAVKVAARLLAAQPIELWQGERLVTRIDPTTP
jgi:hypothetical protein